MFVKVTRSGPRRYVQLVEAFRNDEGKVKHRTIATLGRLDKLGEERNAVVGGLARVSGRTLPDSPSIEFHTAKSFGDIWALTQLWSQVGFDQLRKAFRGSRFSVPVEKLIELMVLNRMTSLNSKLGVLRWMDEANVSAIVDPHKVNHTMLLRAMDALDKRSEAVNDALADMIRPLVDRELSIVFYDMTTITVARESSLDDDLRQFGLSKDGGIRRQVMLGVLQTADGIPLYHEVFEGNTGEVGTLLPIIHKIIDRYPVERVVMMADRGLLSLYNLDELKSVVLPSGNPLEFILAVPGRRYSDFAGILDTLAPSFARAQEEVIVETQWQDLRLIVAHDPVRAAEQTQARQSRIDALVAEADRLANKLDRQDSGHTERGRQLSDGGATAKVYRAESEANSPRSSRLTSRVTCSRTR